MAQDRTDDPKIELAKSGRSTCRTCQKKIPKETPRVGIPFPFTTPSGEVVASYRYYHIDCTPRYKIPEVISFLKRESLEKNDLYETILHELENLSEKGELKGENLDFNPNDPFLQLSKSSRGKCRKCKEKIEKDTVRVAVPSLVELDDGRKFFSNKYYHLICFVDQIENIEVDFKRLVDKSQSANYITEDEANAIKSEFGSYFNSDIRIEKILAEIKTSPIKLKVLKDLSVEKKIDFQLVEAAIEKGLMKGEFFKPTKDTIQKLT